MKAYEHTIAQTFPELSVKQVNLRETLTIVVAVAVVISFPAEHSAGVSNCTLTTCIPLAKKMPCVTLSFI